MRPHRIVRRPRRFLLTTAVLSFTVTTSAMLTGACTTGAIGIAQCREIEYARCEASVPCGVIDDVDACQRFYRDQCLHGIAGPNVPTTDQQSDCVEAIEQAGACAEDDAEGAFADCSEHGGMGGQSAGDPDEPTVCEFLAAPWQSPVCDYLNEAAEGGSSG